MTCMFEWDEVPMFEDLFGRLVQCCYQQVRGRGLHYHCTHHHQPLAHHLHITTTTTTITTFTTTNRGGGQGWAVSPD